MYILHSTIGLTVFVEWNFSNEILSFTENHRLLIVRANGSDAGTYRCSASNQYGQSSSSISIAVEGKKNNLKIQDTTDKWLVIMVVGPSVMNLNVYHHINICASCKVFT